MAAATAGNWQYVQRASADDLRLAYVAIETARLLCDAGDPTRRLLAEAAYYLGDPLSPDQRAEVLADAHERSREARAGAYGPELEAVLLLTNDAALAIDWVTAAPQSASELRIGRDALDRAIEALVSRIGTQRVNELLSGTPA